MILKTKNAQDASEHIVKLLNPGVPYPMQSTGAQSVLAYMQLRDQATLTALVTALEGMKGVYSAKDATDKAKEIVKQLLTPTV